MKIIGFVLMFSVFIVSSVTYAGDKFMHPSTWGTDPSDDHYNTYLEDEDHICRKRWYGFEDECSEPINIYEDGAYAERSCWYGRHCSANHYYHAGIDYEVPNHIHDLDDYVNGQRKTIGIKQGRGGESLGYHGPDDDVKASNCGVVAYANNNTPHRFGGTVILRHVCGPNTPNLQNLCVQEGSEWVIYSQYSHMSKINVSTGDVVSRGQKIGEIGGTGNWIHHLHFEMKTKAVYHSPEKDRSNQISEDARGYTTTDPTNFGYRNPALFIGTVSAVCPGDDSNNSGNGTDESPQIFTEGNHTHILAPSYRCSKETNGPILCWESGLDPNEPDGRRNCWNGWKHYQFNGEISEVAEHRTDSDWITILSKDYTCNEVYSSGNDSGNGNNGGSGYDPGDEGQTINGPDANVANGFRVRIIGGNWQEGTVMVSPGQEMEASWFIKNKGDETIDYFECFLYRSSDLNFNHNADYSYGREEEEDDLDPGETDEKRRNFTAPTTPGIYYLYAYINRVDGEEGGTDQDWSNNTSRSDDPPEYVKLVVEEIPTDDSPNTGQGKTWDQLTASEKAAIMSIIFD